MRHHPLPNRHLQILFPLLHHPVPRQPVDNRRVQSQIQKHFIEQVSSVENLALPTQPDDESVVVVDIGGSFTCRHAGKEGSGLAELTAATEGVEENGVCLGSRNDAAVVHVVEEGEGAEEGARRRGRKEWGIQTGGGGKRRRRRRGS